MWELPFKYDKETKSYTYAKPKYVFVIPDKKGEFIDIYQQDFGYDDEKQDLYSKKGKYITSISKNGTNWENCLIDLNYLFSQINANIRNFKYRSIRRNITDFYTSITNGYIVMDERQFMIMLNDVNLVERYMMYLTVMTDWMHQFMMALCSKSELREFVGVTGSYDIPDFIYDKDNKQIWYGVDAPALHIFEDNLNVYKYFKANECKNNKPSMYDEVFSFDTSISKGNCLQTLSGDASVLAFIGLGRKVETANRCNSYLKKCMFKMRDKNSYYRETEDSLYSTVTIVDWDSIICKYLRFVEQKFFKYIDKVYYMPIKTNDKNVRSIAFKYKKRK